MIRIQLQHVLKPSAASSDLTDAPTSHLTTRLDYKTDFHFHNCGDGFADSAWGNKTLRSNLMQQTNHSRLPNRCFVDGIQKRPARMFRGDL